MGMVVRKIMITKERRTMITRRRAKITTMITTRRVV